MVAVTNIAKTYSHGLEVTAGVTAPNQALQPLTTSHHPHVGFVSSLLSNSVVVTVVAKVKYLAKAHRLLHRDPKRKGCLNLSLREEKEIPEIVRKAYGPYRRFLGNLELLFRYGDPITDELVRKITYVLKGFRRRCPLNWITVVARAQRDWREYRARRQSVRRRRAHFGRRARTIDYDGLCAFFTYRPSVWKIVISTVVKRR